MSTTIAAGCSGRSSWSSFQRYLALVVTLLWIECCSTAQGFRILHAPMRMRSVTSPSPIRSTARHLLSTGVFRDVETLAKPSTFLPPSADHKGAFEGPEKTLEMEFNREDGSDITEPNLRSISDDQISAILEQAQCKVLEKFSNDAYDSYLLSESALFVYKHKLILKTCGTTTLLRSIPMLLCCAKSQQLVPDWITYSRKDFMFPRAQLYPHSSFAEEVQFLNTMFNGSAYVHGPINADHWFTYVADCSKSSPGLSTDRTLNIMMFDLEDSVAQHFFKSDTVKTADDCAKLSGLKDAFPHAHFQHHLFEPCGYSSNIIEGDSYYTAHVTPEKGYSYASFETNARFPTYHDYIDKILQIFRPGRFTVTLVADQSGNAEVTSHPSERMRITLPKNIQYDRRIATQAHFERGYCSHMTNYERLS